MTAKIPISEIADVNPRLPSSLAADEQRIVNFVPMNSVSEEGHITPSTDRRLGDVKKGFTFFANGDVLVAKITPCWKMERQHTSNGCHMASALAQPNSTYCDRGRGFLDDIFST